MSIEDSFTVMVPAGVTTRLPNGCDITVGGVTGNFEVRGFWVERERKWVIEVVGYINSGGALDTSTVLRLRPRSALLT